MEQERQTSLSEEIKISILMVDGSYRENFHSIDFFGDQTYPKDRYELLWVEYYGKVDPSLAEKIERFPNFRIITLNRKGVYHSSYCFNAGISASRGELLLIPDADQAAERDFLEAVWKEHQANHRLVMYVYRYDQPKEKYLQGPAIKYLKETSLLQIPDNYGGCLTLRKKWLVEINGYEQHPVFSTPCHANGRDVYTRLKNLGLYIMWHPKLRLYHPWHPGTMRSDITHKIQQVIVDHRSKTLAALPFQGIDSTKNSEPPETLVKKLEGVTDKQKGGLPPIKRSDKGILQSLLKHLMNKLI